MTSDLVRSKTWEKLSEAIGREFRAGVPFDQIHEMNIAIKQRDLTPYARHRRTLDQQLWYDDLTERKTIVEVGAGYGAMAGFWPEGAHVYNVDLPEMLAVQEKYIDSLAVRNDVFIELVPFTEAAKISFLGAYLFSTWALTETTQKTWEFYIEKAPELAGAYILGHRQWMDEEKAWPWGAMADSFDQVRRLNISWEDPNALELIAVNR